MARVPFSWRTRLGVPLSFFFFSRVVLLYLHSTYQLSLFTFSLSKTPKRRTHKRCLSLWAREILFSRVPCVRDLLTSSPRRTHHVRRKSRISRPVDRAGAHVLPRFSPTIQVAAAQTSESCQSYESKKMRDLCPGTTYPGWPSVAWSIFIILGDLADINGVHPL